VVRIDRELQRPVSGALLKQITGFITDKMKEVDALIIEDYGKGVIVPQLVQQAVKAAKKYNKIITVDPKETHFSYYQGVTTITPNHRGFAAMAANVSRGESRTPISLAMRPGDGLFCTLSGTDATSATEIPSNGCRIGHQTGWSSTAGSTQTPDTKVLGSGSLYFLS